MYNEELIKIKRLKDEIKENNRLKRNNNYQYYHTNYDDTKDRCTTLQYRTNNILDYASNVQG